MNVIKEFRKYYDIDDIGRIYRTMYYDKDEVNITQLFLDHKLIRYIGKGSIDKRAGSLQSGTRINQDHVDKKIFITIAAKGKQILLFGEL